MIKSTIHETKSEPKSEYPCLKVSATRKTIVLFIRPKIGTVVSNDSNFDYLGEYSSSWNEEDFTTFNGTVTLENSNG